MQVRKFEAQTIKDAIELVKFHMGPDAIILAAKDNSKNFGLMGESSVEVTAAVSDTKLAQKKSAEKKLDSRSKQKYMSASAKVQKKYIEKSQENFSQRFKENETFQTSEVSAPQIQRTTGRQSPTLAKYIDIGENDDITQPSHQPAAPLTAVPQPQIHMAHSEDRVTSLQREIIHLRSLLEKFQGVPQNFVTLHPGADEGLPYELSFAFKKLLDAGLSHANTTEILKAANMSLPHEQKKKRAFVDGWMIKYMMEHLTVADKPLKNKFHVFVGPTGQGKTSTVVKIACQLALNEKKRIAVLSGDHVKVGASDQLKIYCQILNVPCGIVTKPQDWQSLEKALQNVDHVLLDTPGVNLKSPQEIDVLRAVLPPNLSGFDVHYVQSAMVRDADAIEVAARFKVFGFKDVIFTRLDEAVQHGLIYNFHRHFDVPLHSFGIGNSIPEDFEFATKERVIDLIFNLSKIKRERGNV